MVNQNHPYYITAVNIYPQVLAELQRAGQITPEEAGMLNNELRGPRFSSFIENVVSQMGSINGESQMKSLIIGNFIEPLVNNFRQSMCGGYGGYNPGYGGGYNPGYVGGYGGIRQPPPPPPGFRGYGMPPQVSMPHGSDWYTGSNRDMRGFAPRHTPPPRPTNTGYASPARGNTPQAKPAPVKWDQPTLLKDAVVSQENKNNTYFDIRKFVGSDNTPITEIFVVDDRPLYKNDQDAIEAYKCLFDNDKSKKVLTVCFRKMVVLNVDRTAFKTLVKAASVSISNLGPDDTVDKIKTVLKVSEQHPAGAVNAFHKLIVDEYNSHVLCGELTDSVKSHLNWTATIGDVKGLLDLLVGNISKQDRDVLNQIKDFDQAVRRITNKVIATVIGNGTAQRIFDPVNDLTVIGLYGLALPPVWRDRESGTWQTTDNFFTRFIAAAKPGVAGAAADAAKSAELTLTTRLAEVDRNYTVLQVPRIITWSNCSASTVVSWNSEGKCMPSAFNQNEIKSDIAFFLDRAYQRVVKSKLTNYTACPCKLICEVDEGTVNLDYGRTNDGSLWIGCLRYA